MIDGLYAARADASENVALEGFDASQAITGTRFLHPDASELAVIFPPWHGAGELTGALDRRTARHSAALSYDFHGHILEPNVPGVVAVHEHLSDTIAEQVNRLRVDNKYETVRLIGMSLGNATLAMTADKLDDFDRATMIVPGSNLALCMWDGDRTQGLRRAIEAQGVTRDELDLAWAGLAPINHVSAMHGRDVRAHISLTDRFIPTEYGEEYVEALADAGANLSVRRSRLGHTMSVIRYCLAPDERPKVATGLAMRDDPA